MAGWGSGGGGRGSVVGGRGRGSEHRGHRGSGHRGSGHRGSGHRGSGSGWRRADARSVGRGSGLGGWGAVRTWITRAPRMLFGYFVCCILISSYFFMFAFHSTSYFDKLQEACHCILNVCPGGMCSSSVHPVGVFIINAGVFLPIGKYFGCRRCVCVCVCVRLDL